MLEMLRLAVAGARRNQLMSGSAARPRPITPRLRGSSQGSASTPSASIRRASCAPSLSWPMRKRAALVLARNWRPPHENTRRRWSACAGIRAVGCEDCAHWETATCYPNNATCRERIDDEQR
jgi:hypothetical protein